MNYKKIRKYILPGALTTAIVGLVTLAVYPVIWESRQPRQEIKNAVVKSIKPYSYVSGLIDTARLVEGNKVLIEGDDRTIDFLSGNWDDSVREGDTVDLEVKRSFPWFSKELYGLDINDHK